MSERAELLADEAAYREIGATREEARSWAKYDEMVLERMAELEAELDQGDAS